MATKAYVYKSWVGGEAVDKKAGQANAFAESQSLDFRKSPSQMSVLPGTREEDTGIVIDLVQNEVMINTGEIFSVGSKGNIYQRTTAGVMSLIGNIGSDGTFGITYRADQDAIYLAGTNAVALLNTVSTTPAINPNFYNKSQSTYDNTADAGFNVNSDQGNGTATIAVGTTLSEANLRYFQTDIQPVSQILVNVNSKGTGDWTMTVHDGLNNVLGTSTVTNANLTSSAWNTFDFTPMELNVGPNNAQTYHWHLVSTVGDGTIFGTATNDFTTADMQLYANRLVETRNGLHPMENFQQFVCIGNGRYLSVWEPLGTAQPSNDEWLRQKLTFPPGYEVCGLTVFNEYLAIATERVATDNDTPQDGIIFYWDGLANTYNYFTKIPEGSPEGIHEYENALHYVASANWYVITSVAAMPEKIRRLPGSENIYTGSNIPTRVYPYTGTVRHGIHLLGWPSVTDNEAIPYGVYSWGRVDYSQPNSFGYSYPLSTGSQFKTVSNNLTIGMVKNFGNLLRISWRDDTTGSETYGMDVVDAASIPAAYATWESLIEDCEIPTKQHQGLYMEAHWLTIQDGVQIQMKYSINRGNWRYSPLYSNSNLWSVDNVPGYARFDMGTADEEERFYEIQIGIDIYCDETVTEPPIIVGASMIVDGLEEEVLQ